MTSHHLVRVPDDGISAIEPPLVGLRDGVEEERREGDQDGDDHVQQRRLQREHLHGLGTVGRTSGSLKRGRRWVECHSLTYPLPGDR